MTDNDLHISFADGGQTVADLHTRITKLGFELPDIELEERRFGAGTREAVTRLQKTYNLPATGELDTATEMALKGVSEAADGGGHLVDGFLVLESGPPVPEGVTVRLYYTKVGEKVELAETETGREGYYALEYGPCQINNVEVAVVDADGNEHTISETTFDPGDHTTMNLVAPNSVVPTPEQSEYLRLTNALEPHLDGKQLAEAREDDQFQDVTFLARSSGWDGRLVALGVKADRIAKDPGFEDIGGEAAYGLVRAGLPTEPNRLKDVGGEVVRRTLTKAREHGVVDLQDDEIEVTASRFDDLRKENYLDRKPPTAVGEPRKFLERVDFGENAEKAKNEFFELLTRHRDAPDKLWASVEQSETIPPGASEQLKLQGKLGYLTGNNPALVDTLERQVGSADDLPKLVDDGFYEAGQWQTVLKQQLPEDEGVDPLVPDAYSASDDDEKLQAYAEDLARKIRNAYPTRVLQHRVSNDEIRLRDDGSRRTDVARFLEAIDEHEDGEFGNVALHDIPLEDDTYFRAELDEPRRRETLEDVKQLERVYQVTPNDDALRVVSEMGFESAHDIQRMGRETFVDLFDRRYLDRFDRSSDEARRIGGLVFRKARQVETTTKTFFSSAKKRETSPPVFAASPEDPSEEDQQVATNALGEVFPTLEGLFGSLDFCECEHCRSLLSPAAYMVDLLQFLDPPENNWSERLDAWKDRHGVRYPFQSEDELDAALASDGEVPPPADLTPYDVLTERRPDLPHIALTCANTNTQLPYIDVVNEIFEYSVAHDELDPDAARDTGDDTSEKLLAEPQHVVGTAYETLRDADNTRYPLELPFDLWTAKVRGFMNHLDTSLAEVMETYRTAETLKAPSGSDPHPYYRVDVFREQLGLSPAQWRLFTEAHGSNWHTFYGYPAAQDAEETNSAQKLARRLDVSYEEFQTLVETRFVNPHLAEVAMTEKLGVSAQDLAAYRDDALPKVERNTIAERIEALEDRFATDYPNLDLESYVAELDLDGIWILDSQTPQCDFSKTILRRIDGDEPTDLVLSKLNLLVRLRDILDWPLAELDRVLCQLIPRPVDELTVDNLADSLYTALVYLAHLEALADALSVPSGERDALLTFWKDMDTTGADPLFARLFLDGTDKHPVFDHPRGEYASDDPGLVSDHISAVRAGIGLSETKIETILERRGPGFATAKLNAENLALLHRYKLLADGLELNLPDLIALEELVEFDPFRPLADGSVEAIDKDAPLETLRFLETFETLKDIGLGIHDADWIVRHHLESPGPHGRRTADVLTWMADLGRKLDKAASSASLNTGGEVRDETLKQGLGEVLPTEVVDTIMRLLDVSDPFDGNGAEEDAKSLLMRHLVETTPALFADENELENVFTSSNAGSRLASKLGPYIREKTQRKTILDSVTERFEISIAQARALVAGTDILADPDASDDEPLSDVLQSARHHGVSSNLYATDDLGGSPAARTRDKTATIDGAMLESGDPVDSVEFEGYLRPSTTGKYEFIASLETDGTSVVLEFDHLADSTIDGTANTSSGGNGGEIRSDGPVKLEAGNFYRFSCRMTNLQTGAGKLEVSGQETPRGPLGQLDVYPLETARRIRRVDLLLAKVASLATWLDLETAELAHVAAHADDFRGLDLSTLPTLESHVPDVTRRFDGLIALVEYARLKRDLDAEAADLVDALGSATELSAWTGDAAQRFRETFAPLADTEPSGVDAAVRHLGFDTNTADSPGPAALARPGPLRRVVEILEQAYNLGASVSSVAEWATPGPDAETADDVRDAVAASHTSDDWREVAQSVFDELRKQKRDALVAYLLHDMDGVDRREELFEYFLIDPGMEPVVRTSRIRLALSSIQTFVQRCLLNLEPHVDPWAIDANQWDWMKRYRVWEANRKIFLYPENWLEPELRQNKTPQFKSLEGSLLEGDVSRDLVEDALYDYLTSLDEIARLQIVSMYAEEHPGDPSANTLHVIGRTHSQPHGYHYRQFAHGTWSPWEPLGVEIDSDHIVSTVYRGRLRVFWVNFKKEPKQNESAKDENFETLAGDKTGEHQKYKVKAQLNWVERDDGSWTDRKTSNFKLLQGFQEVDEFDPDKYSIFVTDDLTHRESETDGWQLLSASASEASGNSVDTAGPMVTGPFIPLDPIWLTPGDGDAVYIHLTDDAALPKQQTGVRRKPHATFEFVSRHADPKMGFDDRRYPHRYGPGLLQPMGNQLDVRGTLGVQFPHSVDHVPRLSIGTERTWKTRTILGRSRDYRLVPTDNPADREEEIDQLARPFFYQDQRRLFFVAPTVQRKDISEWDRWVTVGAEDDDPELIAPHIEDPAFWERIEKTVKLPNIPLPDPNNPEVVDRVGDEAVIDPEIDLDWVANRDIAIDEQVVGGDGRKLSENISLEELNQPGFGDTDVDPNRVVGGGGLIGSDSGGGSPTIPTDPES